MITRYTGSRTEVTIPAAFLDVPVTAVGEWAFWDRFDVTSVKLPATIRNLRAHAFDSCGVTSIRLTSTVTNVGIAAFRNCPSLTSATLQCSIRELGIETFAECVNLRKVTLPPALTTIRSEAFRNCTSLPFMRFPASLTTIDANAFRMCVGLGSLFFLGDFPSAVGAFPSPQIYECLHLPGKRGWEGLPSNLLPVEWSEPDFAFFWVGDGEEIADYVGTKALVSIPATIWDQKVTRIGTSAFEGSSAVKEITIPAGVARLEDRAFADCTNLEVLVFDGRPPALGAGVFDGAAGAVVYYTSTNTGWGTSFGGLPAFLHPTQQYRILTNGTGVTVTGYLGTNRALAIPSHFGTQPVTAIGFRAFFYNTNLQAVTIPSSVHVVGEQAFYNCSSLTEVTIPDSVASIGNSAFAECVALKRLVLPNSVTNIGDGGFQYCGGLTNVILGSGLQSIGVHAFDNCIWLESLAVPAAVKDIGAYAFHNCSRLKQVFLVEGLRRIGVAAFISTDLLNLTIPASCESIGISAFSGLEDLRAVLFLGDAPVVGTNAFNYDWMATGYYLPGRSGFGSRLGGLAMVQWNPRVAEVGTTFGAGNQAFGFRITGGNNLVVVVEASTSLGAPAWSPMSTNTLHNGVAEFVDDAWTAANRRIYRLRSP